MKSDYIFYLILGIIISGICLTVIFFENKSRKKNRFNHNRFKVVNSDISGAFFTGIRFVLILGIMLMFYSILMLLS